MTLKLRLSNISVTVTALVMSSIVPGVHLILGDDWLTSHKVKLDYDDKSMRFQHRGKVVVLPTISRSVDPSLLPMEPSLAPLRRHAQLERPPRPLPTILS